MLFERIPMRACALLLGCSAASHAMASHDPETAGWTVSGFGTLGAVYSSNRHADYSGTVLKPNGAGYTHAVSTDVDSRLGLQVEAHMGQWSAVLQTITEQKLDNSYDPILEWGYLKYQATPDLAIRVGRIALPVFLAADYRKVSYAYPWVRPPVEVYGFIPITNSDGIDLNWRWKTGDFSHATQLFYGKTDVHVSDTATAHARAIAGLSHSVSNGAAHARLSVVTARLHVDILRELFEGFRQFGPAGAAIAERHEMLGKRVTGTSLGVSYDPGAWFAQAEFGRMKTNSFFGNNTSMYASAGYRHGTLTPYLSYASVRTSTAYDPGLPLGGLPPHVAYAATQLNVGLDTLLRTIAEQDTASVGVRWDFASNASLKFQADRVKPHGRSVGTVFNVQPGFKPGRAYTLGTVVLDFVF
jgi:hypothetical protein